MFEGVWVRISNGDTHQKHGREREREREKKRERDRDRGRLRTENGRWEPHMGHMGNLEQEHELPNHHYSKGNIPIFRKSSHTMFSSYSRPGFWYVTLIGISAQSGGNSWPTANPLNAPPQLSIPYVVPKELWTLNELKAALIRKFPHLSTEEGQGCQR